MLSSKVKPVVVALDFNDAKSALNFLDLIDADKCRVKVGKELFTSVGPDIVRAIAQRGFDVFLDLKFHDIPNTTASAVEVAAEMGVWMVNVHVSGGEVMLRECVQRLNRRRLEGRHVPLLIGVTILTSMDQQQLSRVGVSKRLDEQVLDLASLAKECGLDGVVCSAREAEVLKASLGQEFLLVTPGIRPSFAVTDDQLRVMTPSEAMRKGSDYLVIGRPITKSKNPAHSIDLILQEIESGS